MIKLRCNYISTFISAGEYRGSHDSSYRRELTNSREPLQPHKPVQDSAASTSMRNRGTESSSFATAPRVPDGRESSRESGSSDSEYSDDDDDDGLHQGKHLSKPYWFGHSFHGGRAQSI